MGIEIKVTGVNFTDNGRIKLFLNNRLFRDPKETFLIVQNGNSHLLMTVDYSRENLELEKCKFLVKFSPNQTFLNFLGLSWNSKESEILEKLKKIKKF